jgi:hypothetical protein
MPIGISVCGRYGVEADESEEHDGGTAHDAGPAKLTERAGIFRDEGVPIRGRDVADAEQDKGEHDDELDADHDVVESGRFLCSADQHGSE